jgi:hypothetical protein
VPKGEYDPLAPAGEAEQLDNLMSMSGLARQREWRLTAARLVAALLVLGIAGGLVLAVIYATR